MKKQKTKKGRGLPLTKESQIRLGMENGALRCRDSKADPFTQLSLSFLTITVRSTTFGTPATINRTAP